MNQKELMFLVDLLLTHSKKFYYNYNLVNDMVDPVLLQIDEIQVGTAYYDLIDSTVPSWARGSTKPTYNGSEIKYTGTTGNVVTNNTTLNTAVQALDTAVNNRLKYVLLSQAEYDSLTTKDSGTLYLIQNVVTYSVTSTYSGNISSNSYYTINDGEHVALSFPITISEGDKFYCFIEAPKASKPAVTMGGNAITVTMYDPSSWYFTIPSVTGDVVISGGSGSGVIVG